MTAKWRALPFDPRYEVSDDGQVRSWAVPGSRNLLARALSPSLMVLANCNRYGYPQVTVAGKKWLVHQLVALCWEIAGQGPLIRHLDGNPANNRISNLHRGTQSENMRDAYRQGRLPHLRRRRCTGPK